MSEHRLSLELGKSGSYIRSITSGATMPSMKELFNLMVYFEVSPAEFFSGLQGKDTLRTALGEKLRELSDTDLERYRCLLNGSQSKSHGEVGFLVRGERPRRETFYCFI